MKTLDEVIKAFEICGYDTFCKKCPYAVNVAPHPYSHEDYRCSEGKDDDALHYLKELRDMTDIPMEYFESGGTSQNFADTSQITCPKCHSEFVILPEANNPLTWDELKQMEGKPVWVEYNRHLNSKEWRDHSKCWDIINQFGTFRNNPEEIMFTEKGFVFEKKGLGLTWQAYRKERS